MCGIAGIIPNKEVTRETLHQWIQAMNSLQVHRGPDGEGTWIDEGARIGLGHVRLSIIDIKTGAQPMKSDGGSTITYNGEIYNYIELRAELGAKSFRTTSDTEVILRAYERWGEDCVDHLRGMFAFAIWDKKNKKLFCARDRFGIKPFYYTKNINGFYFASEIKALLPFVEEIATDYNGLKDYLAFQFTLGTKTLFRGVEQLLPGHVLTVKNSRVRVRKYWEVQYRLDWFHTKRYFEAEVRKLLMDSIRVHLRSDVPVGSYLSGGLDSSVVASLARKIQRGGDFHAFHGKFSSDPGYDESQYARTTANFSGMELHEQNITSADFVSNIRKVIYHLDNPVAGPGSFPQYVISKLASEHLKVVLGGTGGDEIFGGYVRYLISYFEQCIKGAIEGTMHSGNFVVTYESIIPNLSTLRDYKPLLQEFWREGLFEQRDKRYFRLVNRANGLSQEINWNLFEPYSAFETFREIFWGENVEKESYFDSMTHFDFKTLLPALLQVEDRMSMAHGLESRVPLLDHPLVELVATIPSNIKFENGQLKHLMKTAFQEDLPEVVHERTDKMGFPVPLSDWLHGELRDFVEDIFHSDNARHREYLNPQFDIETLIESEGKFTRKIWGLLSLELWQEEFHDRGPVYRKQREDSNP
ncbi:MAG: asparagine synthase (glutamine-hydrolyzing) [candidate division Zixibacteria bacterium]|nr:asparagine synthase (glutamine-hydrolyzing) [candidate division Zixibacteria bacterium]